MPSRNMMLNPTLKLLCLGSPVIITSFYISCIVWKLLDVTIIALNQFVFKLFNCGRVVTQELSTGKEVTALAIFVTFYAVKNEEREHLISEKMPIIIMQEMLTPLFWAVLSSFDVI